MTLYIICIFIPVLVLILLFLNILLAPSRPDQEKISSYECGFESLGGPRNQFQIAFYMVAILFLIFDLEIAVFYPLASCLSVVSTYGFAVGMLFMLILTAGFVFEYGSGAIKFSDDIERDD